MRVPTKLPVPAWLTLRTARRLAAGWLTIVIIVSIAGLSLLAFDPPVDAATVELVAEHRTSRGVTVTSLITVITQSYVIFPLVLIAGVWAIRSGAGSSGLWIPMLAGAGGFAISIVVKLVVFRPRPAAELAATDSFGPAFPSGHAIRGAAVAFAVAWLISRRWPRWALACWSLAALATITVAASRVYQGVHWPTDVIVGIGIGVAWLALILRFARTDTSDRPDPPPLAPRLDPHERRVREEHALGT